MPAPRAPPPAGPPPAPPPAAPKSLLDVQREQRNFRSKPVQNPGQSGNSSIKVNGKTLTNPTPAQKAGAPAPTPPRGEDGKFVPAAPPPVAAPARGEGAQAAVDSKKALTEQVMGEPEQPRKYKVKIDGSEREVTDAELVTNYQLKSHLDAKLRQIAEYTNLAKKDFDGLVRKLAQEYGQDPDAVAERLLLKKAEKWQEDQLLKNMSPEEREYYELKKDKAARDAK